MSETALTTTATSTEQTWRAITAVLTGAIPPGLGYDPESGFPTRCDDRGRWRWISYLPGPALSGVQVADLLPYRAMHGGLTAELADLPRLAVDPVTGMAAICTADRWWWLRYTAAAPLHPAQVADLVLYQVAGGARPCAAPGPGIYEEKP